MGVSITILSLVAPLESIVVYERCFSLWKARQLPQTYYIIIEMKGQIQALILQLSTLLSYKLEMNDDFIIYCHKLGQLLHLL